MYYILSIVIYFIMGYILQWATVVFVLLILFVPKALLIYSSIKNFSNDGWLLPVLRLVLLIFCLFFSKFLFYWKENVQVEHYALLKEQRFKRYAVRIDNVWAASDRVVLTVHPEDVLRYISSNYGSDEAVVKNVNGKQMIFVKKENLFLITSYAELTLNNGKTGLLLFSSENELDKLMKFFESKSSYRYILKDFIKQEVNRIKNTKLSSFQF